MSISNERNLDTLPVTIETLSAVAETVAGRLPLLMDGGIRRGTDVLKALALGASDVLIGRPVLYGLRPRRCRGCAACADDSAARIGDGHGVDWASFPHQHRPSVLW